MDKRVIFKESSLIQAYKQASEEQKKILENIFGKEMFPPKDIRERVKTFQDAVQLLGYDNQTVIDYYKLNHINSAKDIIAYAKLRVIVEALNEGWKPSFDNEERRYYPWFSICKHAYSSYGYRLALKSVELADYCAKQFIDIWIDYIGE